MAKPKSPAGPTPAQLSLLAAAISTTNGGAVTFATDADMKFWREIAGGPMVESNPDMKDPADATKVAYRATAAGLAYVAAAGAPANTAPVAGAAPAAGATATATVSDFVLEDGIVIPPLRRGQTGTAKQYPFAVMAVGQSFFIPKTTDNPKPSKRIAAVVSTASKNLAPKKFKVQTVTDPTKGEGARVWRVQDEAPKVA